MPVNTPFCKRVKKIISRKEIGTRHGTWPISQFGCTVNAHEKQVKPDKKISKSVLRFSSLQDSPHCHRNLAEVTAQELVTDEVVAD